MNEKKCVPKLITLNLQVDLWLWFLGNQSVGGVITYKSVFHFLTLVRFSFRSFIVPGRESKSVAIGLVLLSAKLTSGEFTHALTFLSPTALLFSSQT